MLAQIIGVEQNLLVHKKFTQMNCNEPKMEIASDEDRDQTVALTVSLVGHTVPVLVITVPFWCS